MFLSFKKNPFSRKNKPKEGKKRIPSFHQLKYLNEVLSLKEKNLIKLFLGCILFSCLILFFQFYFSSSEIVPNIGGNYHEGTIGQPKNINPFLAVDEVDLSLVNLVYSGLLKYDSDFNLIPDLVQEFIYNPEQLEYEFCLKENLFWHNEEKITIDDILFTYTLGQNDIFKNPRLEKLKNLQFEKTAEKCLKIKIEKNNPDIFSILTLGILPKSIWENIKPEEISQSNFNLKPIGSGPYQFNLLARDKDDKIIIYSLLRNNFYYQSSPFLKEINFHFYPDFNQAFLALKNQEINGLIIPPGQINEQQAEIKGFKNYRLNFPYYNAVFLNLRQSETEGKENYLTEKSIRQALSYLTPKDEIFEKVFNKQGTIINGPILPSSAFFNSEIKTYSYDPTAAENILTQAGWKKNENGFYEKNKQILEIELTTVNQSEFEKIAELIQKSWQNIGLKVKLIVIPTDKIKEVIKKRNFQAFLYGILDDFNSDPFSLWHSSQSETPGLNLTGFSFRRSDELLEKASLTNNLEEKKINYREFQEIIANNLPAIFLYNASYSYLIDEKIKGVNINQITHPADRFNEIENWYYQTKRKISK